MKNLVWWLLFIIGVVAAIYAIPRTLTGIFNVETPTLTVMSQSMYPSLTRGDLIFVKAVAPEELKVGTVIVFKHGNGLAVHRVIRLDKETLTTRGDANTAEDEPITYDKVVGRVPEIGNSLAKIPLIGRIALITNPEPLDNEAETNVLKQISRYVWNPVGFSLLVAMPAVLFAASIISDVMSAVSPVYRRKQRRQKRLEQLKKRGAYAHSH